MPLRFTELMKSKGEIPRRPIIALSFVIMAVALFAVFRVIGPTPDKQATTPKANPSDLSMSNEQIKLAQIELARAGPAVVAKRLVVPGTIVPDADRISHVSVKLAGTVAELRKRIGDDVAKNEVIAVLESREVADSKSEYLAARLANDLQQDLANRDKTLWDGRAVPEQQYLRSRKTRSKPRRHSRFIPMRNLIIPMRMAR